MLKSFMYGTLYICILSDFLVCFVIFNMVLSLLSILFIPCFGYAIWMFFYGFADGSYHHTLNLTSTTWVLYSPAHDLVSSRAFCIGSDTNNITEYQEVLVLLIEAASQDIHDLVVFLDSQLVVFHLNHIYTIRNPTPLHLFWRVCLLERSFDFITYRHIPRSDNMIVDSLENFILDWHIAHS